MPFDIHGGSYSIVGIAALATHLFVGRGDAPLFAAPPQPVPIEKLFQQADALLNRRRALGEHAMRVVADNRAVIEDRQRAALDLGQIRYRPAIATLVDDFIPEPKFDGLDANRVALRRFRTAPLGKLFDEYIAIGDPNRLPMSWAFSLRELTPYSIQYARGVMVDPSQPESSKHAALQILGPFRRGFGEELP